MEQRTTELANRTMTNEQCRQWVSEQQARYWRGELPQWKINLLERVTGWTWGDPSRSKP